VLLNLFNAQNILDKQSLYPESLGTIASPCFCVCDDALHPANVAAETFDGEGTPTRRISLIRDYVLTGFLHSAGTASQCSTHRSREYRCKVTVSSHFMFFPGAAAAEQEYSLNAEM